MNIERQERIMFGVSEKTANTIFKFVIFPFSLLAILIVIALPIATSYFSFSYFFEKNNATSVIIGGVVALIAYLIIDTIVSKIYMISLTIVSKIFFFIIDIEPSNGLTEDEAKAIAIGGRRASTLLELSKKKYLDYNDIERFIDVLPYVIRTRYYFKVRKRLEILNEYAAENNVKPLEVNEWQVRKIFDENKVTRTALEEFFGNSIFQYLLLKFSLLILSYFWLVYMR